jgi:hypothetical protein
MQNQRLSKALNPIFGSKGFEPPPPPKKKLMVSICISCFTNKNVIQKSMLKKEKARNDR